MAIEDLQGNHAHIVRLKHDTVYLKYIKQILDYFISIIILLVFSPLIIILTTIIRISGKGPAIYKQDRIGRNGKPFLIYKFRSMVFDAETGKPKLSGHKDERVTRLGKFMRQYRIDELPNFINVLLGDMSIVGPRPERQFYIDQIIKALPEYLLLQEIKPGITSWGEIKYGYATSVEEMIVRAKYDLYYLENRSLWFDIKIVFRTFCVIMKGKGI